VHQYSVRNTQHWSAAWPQVRWARVQSGRVGRPNRQADRAGISVSRVGSSGQGCHPKYGFEVGLELEVEIFVDREQFPEVQAGGYMDANTRDGFMCDSEIRRGYIWIEDRIERSLMRVLMHRFPRSSQV
jgi:hypothetical protein